MGYGKLKPTIHSSIHPTWPHLARRCLSPEWGKSNKRAGKERGGGFFFCLCIFCPPLSSFLPSLPLPPSSFTSCTPSTTWNGGCVCHGDCTLPGQPHQDEGWMMSDGWQISDEWRWGWNPWESQRGGNAIVSSTSTHNGGGGVRDDHTHSITHSLALLLRLHPVFTLPSLCLSSIINQARKSVHVGALTPCPFGMVLCLSHPFSVLTLPPYTCVCVCVYVYVYVYVYMYMYVYSHFILLLQRLFT